MNKKPSKLILLMTSIIGVTASVVACHSNDLGSAKPDKIQVNLALSGWDSGAGLVIAQKCANCHTSQRSASVPANTPNDLDGIENPEFFKDPANRWAIRAMLKRIETTDAVKQMPPKFATPLYDDEKAAVIAFLKAMESESNQPNPCPKSTSSSLLKGSNEARGPQHSEDDDDHDDDHPTPPPLPSPPNGNGESGPVEQATDNGANNPCGNPASGGGTNPPNNGGSTPPPSTPPAKVTFSDIQPIVAKACGSCHGAGSRLINLVTRADFANAGSLTLDEINAGSMPKRYTGTPPWKETADGKLVIQWLQGDMSQ